MTTSRLRLLVLAVGLATAGTASAANLTVYARVAGQSAPATDATYFAIGSVTSTPAGIACQTNGTAGCVANFDPSSSPTTANVFLDPAGVSSVNSTFVGWTGCSSVTGQTCNIIMGTGARSVTANYKPATYALQLKTYGTTAYNGYLTSSTGLDCQTGAAAPHNVCLGPANNGATVTITANPPAGAKVKTWSGCTPTGPTTCTATMASAKTVSATFTADGVPVQVNISGPGTVFAASATNAVNCPGDCAGVAAIDVDYVLSATPAAGTTFLGGTGCAPWVAAGAAYSCTLTPAQLAALPSLTVNVTFKPSGCAACHGVPPAGHTAGIFANAMQCGDCHVGYTATTVVASAHMDGHLEVNCEGCHGTTAPDFHAANPLDPPVCSDCHQSISSTQHTNGLTNGPALPAPIPASFGFNLEIVEFVSTTTVPGYSKGYIILKATDNATPTPTVLDLISLISTCGTYSGTPTNSATCDGSGNIPGSSPAVALQNAGSNRTPRISIGKVLADGSFQPILKPKTATSPPLSSETLNTARLTAVGDGTYRYTPEYGFVSSVAWDAASDYRAVVYGGRYFKSEADRHGAAVGFYATDYLDNQGTGTVRSLATVNDAKCNGCHGELTLHGMRRGVNVCLTCHNPNYPLGSGNTDAFKWDLANLVHKLHSGMNYDGISPYTGVQGLPWGSTMDASHMAMGPSHQTYFEGAGAATPGTTADDNVHQLPTEIQCKVCHDTAKTDHLVASQRGCSSCHPINWVTGAGHGSAYPNEPGHPHTDAECADCHPQSGPFVLNFAAVPPVMQVPVGTVHSALREPATGVDFAFDLQFQGSTDAAPRTVTAVPFNDGEQRHKLEVFVEDFLVGANTFDPAALSTQATIIFAVKLDGQPYTEMVAARAGSYDTSAESKGAVFPTCAFTLAGPADSDYVIPSNGSNNLSCGSATGSTAPYRVFAVDAPNGKYRMKANTNVTSGTAFPDGTYTLSYEMMYSRQGGTPSTGLVRKPFAAKPNFYTMTKSGSGWTFNSGTPRRAVVSFDKCNACHVQIGFHSNQGRQGPDYCAVCHNPKLDNGTRDRVKFADARFADDYVGFLTTQPGAGEKVYLVESVSMNMFIHRIHMGDELPSVQMPANAGPWVPEPGRIFYGATRSNFVGTKGGAYTSPADDTLPPSITDLSNFAMPNPMGRCNQCHISDATWKLPEGTRAPVERKFKLCKSVVPAFANGEQWCEVKSTSGPATLGTLVTPPLKAVCTSCHDSAATDAHADVFTTDPMKATAIEQCAQCHGTGAVFDVNLAHEKIP